MSKELKIEEDKFNWVYCPKCGYKMNISYKIGAKFEGVFVRCKGCKKVFEIKSN